MIADESKVLTAETELLLHHYAYGCYQNGHFDKATRTFQFLTMFRASNFRYWFGLGSAFLAWKKESEAIQPFRIAAALDKEDPRPHVYLAECLVKDGQAGEATKVLYEAERLLIKQANSSFHENIKMIKDTLTQLEIST